MKIKMKKVYKGDFVSRQLKGGAFTKGDVPADGVVVGQNYQPSLYIPWSKFDELRNSESEEALVDSWGFVQDGEE